MRSALLVRGTLLALSTAILSSPVSAHAQDPASSRPDAVGSASADPVITVDYSNPGLAPSAWTLTVHPDGTAHFTSEMAPPPRESKGELGIPKIDRDIQVSPRFAAGIFATAEHHSWFNQQCESHQKVAFQGNKKVSYRGPHGSGSCTFNYSKDKEIESLGDSLVAVASTVMEGVKLELLLQHDPLGLDREIEALASAAHEGRAQQLNAITDILQHLAQDDHVMDKVRKQATLLLARGDS